MPKRKHQPREMRLIAEWLALQFPRDQFKLNARVGQLHPELHPELLDEAEQRLVGVWLRHVDAVVIKPEKLILVEAAILAKPGKISQLLLYKELLPQTYEFKEFSDRPIEMILLVAIKDPVIVKIARRYGIKVIYFRPEWIDAYLDLCLPSERRAPLTVL